MAELVAVGKDERHRWWQTIPTNGPVLLGRAPRNGWSVPWDLLISREHAYLHLQDGKLHVTQLETARNPVLFNGQPAKQFRVDPDGEFRIGETIFRFEVGIAEDKHNATIVEHTLSEGALTQRHFTDAASCLGALCQLPAIIAEPGTNADLALRMVNLILQSLSGASAVAVMQYEVPTTNSPLPDSPKLLRWDSRDDSLKRFRPSRRLIHRAFERQQSIVHLWNPSDENSEFTMTSNLDWALCIPIVGATDELWCLYVTGKRDFKGMHEIRSPRDLMAELRLAELMAQFLGAARKVRSLERQQVSMRQFFSPAVVEQLSSPQGEASLEPRTGPVSVLFCDIRGFSQKVEQAQADLPALLGKISEALSVMTRNILKYEGVIADFQGDAALGFWGWPSHSEDSVLLASRAALAIYHTFSQAADDPNHPLSGFEVGIGLGHGNAVSGRIGSQEQIKVGVFGPVVNLSARLQDLTKRIRVPILVDKTIARAFMTGTPQEDAICRPIARLRPAGTEIPVDAFALQPTTDLRGQFSTEQLAEHREAVGKFIAGDWPTAYKLLDRLPVDDGPSQFLLKVLNDFNQQCPAEWDGVLNLTRDGQVAYGR